LRHQTMDKVQKYNSFNTNTPSSESYISFILFHTFGTKINIVNSGLDITIQTKIRQTHYCIR